MKPNWLIIAGASAGTAASAACLAQSNVVNAHRHCWAENAGYIDWRADASAGPNNGARLVAGYLAGFIWSENVGWIRLGDGSPGVPTSYTNATASDHGVNINAASRELSGYAWGENIGWINFAGGAMATPANPARLAADGRLHGYAWSENIGWINLDHAGVYVQFCKVDINFSGSVTVQDIFDFLAAYFADAPAADFNGVGGVTVQDIFDFLAAYFAGC